MPASRSSSDRSAGPPKAKTRTQSSSAQTEGKADESADAGLLSGTAEQLLSRIADPLGFVLITRERIQETLDEAVARGRMTRSDANDLATELIRRGRQQTDELLGDLERLLERGRDQLESSGKGGSLLADGVGRLVRTADRARRTVTGGSSLPIVGYHELTAPQVQRRLEGLTDDELRSVRAYERDHAQRKTVLDAIAKAIAAG